MTDWLEDLDKEEKRFAAASGRGRLGFGFEYRKTLEKHARELIDATKRDRLSEERIADLESKIKSYQTPAGGPKAQGQEG